MRFLNLIENGIKYNVDGGWIKVSLNSDHRNFYIKVADSGVGIPEDCINHIFERFYRVDQGEKSRHWWNRSGTSHHEEYNYHAQRNYKCV